MTHVTDAADLAARTSFPAVARVRQVFPRPRVADAAGAVRRELARLLSAGTLRPGARVGITAGSRGIRDMAEVIRVAAGALLQAGARPFIIPAMGSHGGATAGGQRKLLAHYGITEDAMGVPILDSMATRDIGRTPEGVQVFLSETAIESDAVLLVNRVKPHTDFKGSIESGLTKICSVGLGKYEGAREYHSHVFGMGLGEALRSAARHVLATGKILGGLAILENAYHETARIEAVGIEGFFAREERLLTEARALMPRLPLDEVDVLVCDRMGKNISGTGLDTNIIGRSVHGYVEGTPWHEGLPVVWRIVVRDLSAESEGNAVGMGMVDFAPRRFEEKIDFRATVLNAVTACAPLNTRLPAILPSDREALAAAIATAPRRAGGPLLVHVRDTLDLEDVYVSEACLARLEGRPSVEILTRPAPLRFDGEGSLVSPLQGGGRNGGQVPV